MRSKKAEKRLLPLDPIYNSRLVTRFINKLMSDGRRATAQKLVYEALEAIKEQSKQDPVSVFEKAILNVSPKMEVRPRRVGGASYQVPVEVRGDRKEALAIRWVLAGAKSKPNKEFHSFAKKLAAELLDAANNAGVAIKKKDEVQKIAQNNRAFSHYQKCLVKGNHFLIIQNSLADVPSFRFHREMGVFLRILNGLMLQVRMDVISYLMLCTNQKT